MLERSHLIDQYMDKFIVEYISLRKNIDGNMYWNMYEWCHNFKFQSLTFFILFYILSFIDFLRSQWNKFIFYCSLFTLNFGSQIKMVYEMQHLWVSCKIPIKLTDNEGYQFWRLNARKRNIKSKFTNYWAFYVFPLPGKCSYLISLLCH